MAYLHFPRRLSFVFAALSFALAPNIGATTLKDVRAGFPTNCKVDEKGHAGWLRPDTLENLQNCVSEHAKYSSSDNKIAKNYQSWHRRDDYPIKSPAHGGHYVTIYANETAVKLPEQEVLPGIAVGSSIATPIFAVGGDGKVSAGPMLIMEKMKPGFNTPGGDWRYTLIAPDGTVIGDNSGTNKETINFCKHCSGIFADSVFASLLKGEPPRAPIRPRERQVARPAPEQMPASDPAPAKPALLPPPAEYPVSQGPKPRPAQLPETLDPSAPVLDPSEPTAKAAAKAPAQKEDEALDGLKTLRRETPKS